MIQNRNQPRRSSGGAAALPGWSLLPCLAAGCLLAASSGCAPPVPEVGAEDTPRFDSFASSQFPQAPIGDEGPGERTSTGFSPEVPLGSLSATDQGSQFENHAFELQERQREQQSQSSLQKFERLFEKREFAKALAVIEPLVRERPDDPQVLLGAAATYRETGDSIRAVPLLERVIVLAPEHAAARKLLCIIQTEQGRTAAAMSQIEPLIAAGTDDAEVFALRAAVRLKAGNLPEAEADAARSLEIDPQTHKALLVRCMLRLQKGELDGAREDLLAARRAGALESSCAPLTDELKRRTAARQQAGSASPQP